MAVLITRGIRHEDEATPALRSKWQCSYFFAFQKGKEKHIVVIAFYVKERWLGCVLYQPGESSEASWDDNQGVCMGNARSQVQFPALENFAFMVYGVAS